MQIDDLGANGDHSHLQAEASNRILPELNLLWKRSTDKNEFPSPAWTGNIPPDTEYFHQSNSNRFLTQSWLNTWQMIESWLWIDKYLCNTARCGYYTSC